MSLIIKEILRQRNIGIIEFAERIGISRVALHAQINGNPKIDTIQKWADALELDISELFRQTNTRITCPNCGKELKINAEP